MFTSFPDRESPGSTATSKGTSPRFWWRDAVVYRVCVHGFLDSTGDGVGDLAGVRAGLPYLRKLGVDGIWLSPFYPSPQHDHGYDVADYQDIDPAFGDLEEFGALIADAHRLDIKVVVDIVPNHCSTAHPWFREALIAGPGSGARARFHFADGRSPHGDLPPNNWRAMFGGPAWSRVTERDGVPGQWYLHLFTPDQPDLNWRNPSVPRYFERVLRFWLGRGVDGFRVDAAMGLFKHPELPDSPDPYADERSRDSVNPLAWNRPEVHDIWRKWRAICDEYRSRDRQDRLLVGEVSVRTVAEQARYVRSDELHQVFFYHLLKTPWNADAFRETISDALRDVADTESTATWVLNHHDRVRTVTRYGGENGMVGPGRARAAALLMLALPGAAYISQGEELGLPEIVNPPDQALTDPILRLTPSRGTVLDGCLVAPPLQWSCRTSPFGFTTEPGVAPPRPPQPTGSAERAKPSSALDSGSFWHLYRDALMLRAQLPQLGEGPLRWIGSTPDVLAFQRGDGLVCAVNFGEAPVPAPLLSQPLLSSGPVVPGTLPGNTTGWWAAAEGAG